MAIASSLDCLNRWRPILDACEESRDVTKILIASKCDTSPVHENFDRFGEMFGFTVTRKTSAADGTGIQELREAVRTGLFEDEETTDEALTDVAIAVHALSDRLCELIAENPNVLMEIEWRDLERLLSRALAELGFSVNLTPPAKDGGKDIIVNCTIAKEEKTYYIEVKHWRSSSQPGDRHVSDFVSVNARDATDGGLFISSTGFTQSVYGRISELTRQRIRLGEEEKIVSLCKQYVRKRDGLWQPDSLLPDLLFENTIGETRS
ncbi:MAG: restriction endonuclease [Cyanobacteria bacterium J06638_20]